MHMEPAHARSVRMLLWVVLLKTFPGFFMKVEHDGITGRLNNCQQTAHHHAASEQIAHSEGNGKV